VVVFPVVEWMLAFKGMLLGDKMKDQIVFLVVV
jgi:hypothetical protein